MRRLLVATNLHRFTDQLSEKLYLQSLLAKKRVYRLLDRAEDERNLMINVGGGYFFRRHWRVLDFPSKWYSEISPFIDYKLDLTAPVEWPFRDGQVRAFFSSHTIEHIPQEHCAHIFGEMYRCLQPGGAVRLTCPDFDLAYDAYERRDEAFFVKYPGADLEQRFLDFFATHLKTQVSADEVARQFRSLSRDEFADHFCLQIPRASQLETTGNHINWWTFAKLDRMLRDAGFRTVYRSTAQASQFPEMRGEGRLIGFDSTHPEISLFVEATK